MELLSPAGSAEGVSAAVQSGADAVYLSFSAGPDTRKYDLSEDELGRGLDFCRVRGVKVYVVIDGVPSDGDFSGALDNARRASRMGADAVIVSDIGLIWAIRRAVPSLPIHAGEGLGIHSLDGLKLCAAMGVRRAALIRELPQKELEHLCKSSPIEVEVAVHGPNCVAYGGQCLLPALKGESAGICGLHCLRDFSPAYKGRHPLAMKDLCLIEHIDFLKKCGVAAVRIDGRGRRPEYAAAVTGVYARAIGTGRGPSQEDLSLLQRISPAGGLTDGYLTGGSFAEMMASPREEDRADTSLMTAIRRDYLNHEFQRIPVHFAVALALNEPVRVTAKDDRGNAVSAEGDRPTLAFHQEATPAILQTELYKTGGTPFLCEGVTSHIQKGVWLEPRALAPIRDQLLRELLEKRHGFEPRAERELDPLPVPPAPTEPPVLTVFVRKCAQLSPRLLALAPPVIYLPLEETVSGDKRLEPFLSSNNITVCAALPPRIPDGELGQLTQSLLKARQLGINELLIGSIGQVIFARRLGFEIRGDSSLNVKNSHSLAVLTGLKLKSAALSMELPSHEIRSMRKHLDTELTVYGRMPLMITAGCLIRAIDRVCSCDAPMGIRDADGFENPVTRDALCRNILWSAKKLHLAHRSREYLTAGLWGVRLSFTTENAAECARICERYLELGSYEPASATEGLF